MGRESIQLELAGQYRSALMLRARARQACRELILSFKHDEDEAVGSYQMAMAQRIPLSWASLQEHLGWLRKERDEVLGILTTNGLDSVTKNNVIVANVAGTLSNLITDLRGTLAQSQLSGIDNQIDPHPEPPKTATFLLRLVMPQEGREAMIGDLIEEYTTVMIPQHGRKAGDFWFWSQAIRSVAVVVMKRMGAILAIEKAINLIHRLIP
jgi:hypothetical protein